MVSKRGREPRRGPRQATGVGSVEYEVEHKEPRWWWWSTRSRESHRKSRWRLRSNGRTLRKDEVRKSSPSIGGGRSSRDRDRAEIEIEVETETPQGQVNRQEAEEEPRWSPVKPGEPIKSEMTTGDAW
uniref:Uncharacterized protein n=1 Tax=Fagus sylvatica TaxID=28930 RepID=A0A2N9FL74_FAGSY